MNLAYSPMVAFAQGHEIPEGLPKREQCHGDPPEPNPLVRRERIGYRTAAGDGAGGMQHITLWAMKCFSVGEIAREGRLRSAGVSPAQRYGRLQFDGSLLKKTYTGFFCLHANIWTPTCQQLEMKQGVHGPE